MALNDLTNPINLPNGIDTANANPVAKAEKVVVTGTNQSVTEALNDKEASLGNPTANGQVLTSQTDGTRSWQTLTGSGLPANQTAWLGETSNVEIPTTTVTNIAPSVTDSLIWRRSAEVQLADIATPGIGLVIAEANRQSDGTFDRQSGTSVYNDDLANAFIYIGITASEISSLTLSETFLEARRGTRLVFSSALSDLVQNPITISQFRYFRTTNAEYNYIAGDVLTVVTRSTSVTSTEYRYSDNGDFTNTIEDLPFTAVDAEFNARLRGVTDNETLTIQDTVKLNGLNITTTTQTGVPLTLMYKEGDPSANISDYTLTWNVSNPVLASFSEERVIWVITTKNVTALTISNNPTISERYEWIPNRFLYKITFPVETGGATATSYLPTGTIQTITPSGLNSNYKIVRANIEQNLLNQIDQHGTNADISSLEQKVNALFPLTPDVDILINWANIYDPIHGAATVDIVEGYSSIADYRSSTVSYIGDGPTFGTGTDVITFADLTANLHRSFGFALPLVKDVTLTGTSGTANITVNGVEYLATFATDLTTTATNFVTTHATALNTAGVIVTSNEAVLTFTAADPSVLFTITDAVNATGDLAGTEATRALADKTLMWIVDGSEKIPFVDITSGGNIRVNNYTPAETTSTVVTNQFHFLSRQSGGATVSQGSGNQRFAITNFPAGATQTSRSLQIDIDVFVNGVDTFASHEENVSVPATNTAQALQTFNASVNLGPLHGNRIVPVTIGYEYIVDGADLDVRLTVVSAPSDISINFDGNTAAILNYTAQNTAARVDNFLNFTDAGGNYTFSGQQEFILSMRPQIGIDGNQTGIIEVVAAAVGENGVIDQLNDTNVRTPTPLWTDIQVADDIGFKTFIADHYFRHSEVAGLLQHRTEKWAYGLARLQTINAGHSITEALDLATGTTIGGSPIIATVQEELVVYEATGKGTGAGELVSSVVLPANYASYKYIHITEYDVNSLQFRHAEVPTYIFSAGLVDTNDNVRLQGNTVMQWTAATRTLAMNPTAQEILRVTLKD